MAGSGDFSTTDSGVSFRNSCVFGGGLEQQCVGVGGFGMEGCRNGGVSELKGIPTQKRDSQVPPSNRMIYSSKASHQQTIQQQLLPLQLLLAAPTRDTLHSGQQVTIIWLSQISQWFCLAERWGPLESIKIRIIHHRSSNKVKPFQLLPHSFTQQKS